MFSIITSLFLLLVLIIFSFVLVRLFLYRTALIYVLKKWLHWVEDRVHVYQFFKVPELNENSQENQFYRKVFAYLNSLASIEDSDFTNLFAGRKSNDIVLCLDDNQTVHDEFLGARVSWKNEIGRGNEKSCTRTLVLRIKKKDKRRILRPYLQHIHKVSDEIEQRRREVRLFMNTHSDHHRNGRWISVPFTHPSSFDTIVMDSDLKNKVKSDLESFLKSKQYYHRLGRVWKRSFLLYGPSGTGKSSFVAAMAKFLCYDVFDVDLFRVTDDSDLKMLLLQTTSKSIIVIEDLDRFMAEKEKSTTVTLSGVLNFMDGLVSSCCGDERVMVFTLNNKEQIDSSILRPGRIDVHIHFPLCDFNSFKSLANNYLGLKDHKLFPQVEEVFQGGATLSAAEIGEIMIANRNSPSRALRSVITAARVGRRLSESSAAEFSGELGGGGNKDGGVPAIKEIRKLYGILRLRSSNKIGPSDHESTQIVK
ncbi:AAA-ATPase At2g46620-like [Camellia sinensis]|uniref:AAA-ATPase At2g46620-like n=1 Tax=Camellia sinensis TaxID=4442 RepID=UPI0010362AF2|nr:AAA-ATPase At2g46620-like [Camellia sinensis]